MTKYIIISLLILLLSCTISEKPHDYPIQPVPFTDVTVSSGFWYPRMETNRRVTIPYDFKKCEETGRISNFAKAGGLEKGEFEGIYFNDSDVFKVIEGASYSLSLHPDPILESYLDSVITLIAAAQEEDGYLYTNRTINPEKAADKAGEKRWTNLGTFHELYNIGHMYEAAVAYYQATGKRTFLDVALKNADLINSVFGPDNNMGVPGHEEIEIGLVKLYRITGDKKYLDLAQFFIDQRGDSTGHKLFGAQIQDHKPVVEQAEAVGHAVRAGYLYAGIADIAALTGEQKYIQAINRIWANFVTKKIYITGGAGASRHGESFGENYQLPNASAYNETCAAIASMLFNHRLFLLHGDAKYMDVFERTLYNGFLAGISMEGNTFFYPNPLEFDGNYRFNQGKSTRSPWFDCSCCPVNVVRIIPSIPGYIYGTRKDDLFVNLYIESSGKIRLDNKEVRIEQKTNYPWNGNIVITLNPETSASFNLYLRIPIWAQNQPLPGDLYSYAQKKGDLVKIKINDQEQPISLEKGYVKLSRKWKAGDKIELNLPMPVRKVISHELVKENENRMALERGPLVYCAEGIDNYNNVLNMLLSKEQVFAIEEKPSLLGGITIINGQVTHFDKNEIGSEKEFTAIPYYAWAHRGIGEMAVWLPMKKTAF